MNLETNRIRLELSSDEYMAQMIQDEPDEGMKQAYREMYEGAVGHPEAREWNAIWLIRAKDREDTVVGDMCFKGLSMEGVIEIGYGMKPEFEGQGYMTEAVTELCRWASTRPEVKRIEAESEPDNIASHRVLEKAGFCKNGVMGVEGPRFTYEKK